MPADLTLDRNDRLSPSTRAVRPLLLLSVVLYAACLTQDAYCYVNDRVICISSFSALLFGTLGWLGDINTGAKYAYFTWWANILLLLGWRALWIRGPWWIAFPFCAASLAIAPWHLQAEFHSNGWTGGRIVSHDEGYWLWLASMGVATLASLLLPWRHPYITLKDVFFPWAPRKQTTVLGAARPAAEYEFDWQPVLFKALGETQLRPVARCKAPDLTIWMSGNIPVQTRYAHVLCAEGLAIFTLAYVPAARGRERWIVMDQPVSFWPLSSLPDSVGRSHLVVWQPFKPDGDVPITPELGQKLQDLILPALRRWPA